MTTDRSDRDRPAGTTSSPPSAPTPPPAVSPDGGAPAPAVEEVETGTVPTNGIDTYYVRCGEGGGERPPVVFIHGMAMSAAMWEPQMAALDDYETVAYDVRGHGHTGGSPAEEYSIELFAEDLDAVIDGLDLERPVLCGLSMGGCIAQVYAARHPEEVAGIVVADTFTAAPLRLKGRLVFANLRFLGWLDGYVRYTTLNRVQTWVGARLAPGVAGDRATTQRLMEAGPTIPHAEFRKIARAVASFPDGDFDVSRIAVPTLVMYGEHEPAVLRDVHARIVEQLTEAGVTVTVTTVPDAGHASNVDNPDFFTRTLREFLEGREGTVGR